MDSMLRAGRRALVMVGLAFALAAGCTPGATGDDDGGSGQDAGPDATPGQAGLVFRWRNLPTLPGGLGEALYLDEVTMPLRDVRAIGDAAPGDSRTYLSSRLCEWRHGEAPPELSFPNAPPGLYSRFEFRIQSASGKGYELTGEIVLPGHLEPIQFKIHDSQMLPVSLPLVGVSLEPGQVKTIEVQIDIAAVLKAIHWENLHIEDDEIEIDEDSSEIAIVRATLAGSITAHVVE